MISLKNTNKEAGAIWSIPDLSSMLDIFFILLFFLMMIVGSIFQTLEIKLPQSLSADLPPLKEEKKIVLEIGAKSYALNGHKFSDFSELKSRFPSLLKAKPDHKLLIAGEKSISIERLLQVLSYLQSQNIALANIVMQSTGNPPAP